MARTRSHAREPIELTIEALGAGGDGVAHAAGEPVYVPWTLPGERVRARPVAPRRALPVEWLARAPGRAEPACRHFGAGGGCALRHLAAAAYLGWKLDRAREALARAGFPDAPLAALVRARPGTRRRASFAARRVGDGAVLGFHAPLSAEIVDVAECAVLAPALVALVPALRALAAAWPPPGGRCDFAATLTETGIDLLAVGAPAPDRARREHLADFAAANDLARLARAESADATPELLAQRRAPRVTPGGVALEPPPGAFLQATADGE